MNSDLLTDLCDGIFQHVREDVELLEVASFMGELFNI